MHLEIENIHHPQIKNMNLSVYDVGSVSYTHLRAHET